MNEISIIISGNLTGFSRFFTFDADNRMIDAKFDFDFRNQLSSLKNEQSAYVLSFAPKVIAYSKVNRILDAYRRPGILVTSVLLPRNTILKSSQDSEGKHSIYQLLNSVQERFLTRHVKNGMLDTNASLLMQNDYADIISAYDLSTSNHRMINSDSVKGGDGYVVTGESLVKQYLTNPCRKKFNGYTNIFLIPEVSSHMSNVIDEPAEETISYSVLLNGRNYTEVLSFDEKISFYEHKEGDEPLDVQYSYNEIIGGADNRLKASKVGETIYVTYTPKVVMYPLSIFFVDRNGQLLDTVQYINNICIYADKNLCKWEWDDNGDICIPSNLLKAHLEIRESVGSEFRLMNNALSPRDKNYVIVESVLPSVSLDFSRFSKLKTIVLTNRSYPKVKLSKEVGPNCTLHLFGKIEDWNVEITSDYYQDAKSSLSDFLQYPISLKEKNATEVTFSVCDVQGKRNIRLIVNDKVYNFPSSKPNKTVSILTSKVKYEVSCDGYYTESGEKSLNNGSSIGVKVTMKPTFLSRLKINLKYIIPIFLFLVVGGGGTVYLLKHKESGKVENEKSVGNNLYEYILKFEGSDDLSTKMINEMFNSKKIHLVDNKGNKYDYSEDLAGFSFNLKTKKDTMTFDIKIKLNTQDMSVLPLKIVYDSRLDSNNKFVTVKKLDRDSLMITYFYEICSEVGNKSRSTEICNLFKAWAKIVDNKHSEKVDEIRKKLFPENGSANELSEDYLKLCDPSTSFCIVEGIRRKYNSKLDSKEYKLAKRLSSLHNSDQWPSSQAEFNGLKIDTLIREMKEWKNDQLVSWYLANYMYAISLQALHDSMYVVYITDF